jgi:hypothetical protein
LPPPLDAVHRGQDGTFRLARGTAIPSQSTKVLSACFEVNFESIDQVCETGLERR